MNAELWGALALIMILAVIVAYQHFGGKPKAIAAAVADDAKKVAHWVADELHPAAPATSSAVEPPPTAGGGGADVDAAHAALDAKILALQTALQQAQDAKADLRKTVTQATADAHAAAKP